nr:polyprotein [Bovine retrovirus CH15]
MEPIALSWKSNEPIWIEQWPLTREKLQAAEKLVEEQLQKGHIETSTSPWNSPIFVIRKKSGKWRLLTDLRAVNASMFPMGALQPGLPAPVMLPRDWPLLIIDLLDCFFTIPIHPQDKQRFAFSIPKINNAGPHTRYQWRVLPQGMMNSPTICQLYVDAALKPIRKRYPFLHIYHYMDDILFAGPKKEFLQDLLEQLPLYFKPYGLIIAPEKIQLEDISHYLGFVVSRTTVHPQKMTIRRDNLKTLNDFQKLLGDINWLRPSLGIPTYQLHNLFDTLKGDTDLNSARRLTPAAEEELQFFEHQLKSKFLMRIDPLQPLTLYLINTFMYPTALLGQNEEPCEWLYTRHRFHRSIMSYEQQIAILIQQGRQRCISLSGYDVSTIVLPLTKSQFFFLLQRSEALQIALAQFVGNIEYTLPKGKLWDFFKRHNFVINQIISDIPLEGPNVFTDGSRQRSAYWAEKKYWSQKQNTNSIQKNELLAIIQVLKDFNQDINIIADSAYVVGVVKNIIGAVINSLDRELTILFKTLQVLLTSRNARVFIVHIRSHSKLPGPLVYGNEQVDKLAAFASPEEEHRYFHNNAGSLHHRWRISWKQAKDILSNCQICRPLHLRRTSIGVNPRGLAPDALWQMDVTHIPEFGHLKYVHVVIDTYSRFIWATPQGGETVKHVIAHLLESFAVLGVPQTIKTDNGPAYSSNKFKRFLTQYKIHHITGIEYNPQGQAIIERAHGTLKLYIKKLKKRGERELELPPLIALQNNPRAILSQVLFTLNFMNLPQGDIQTTAERHFEEKSEPLIHEDVWVRPLMETEWVPAQLLVKGKGYGLVLLQNGKQQWLPACRIQARRTTGQETIATASAV